MLKRTTCPPQQAPDMAGVIDDIELPEDCISDTFQRPAVIWVTVGSGPLLEQCQ